MIFCQRGFKNSKMKLNQKLMGCVLFCHNPIYIMLKIRWEFKIDAWLRFMSIFRNSRLQVFRVSSLQLYWKKYFITEVLRTAILKGICDRLHLNIIFRLTIEIWSIYIFTIIWGVNYFNNPFGEDVLKECFLKVKSSNITIYVI